MGKRDPVPVLSLEEDKLLREILGVFLSVSRARRIELVLVAESGSLLETGRAAGIGGRI